MDPQRAVRILLAAAGLLGAGGAAAADSATVATPGADEADPCATGAPRKMAVAEAGQILMKKYGMAIQRTAVAGQLLTMQQLAQQTREALAVIATPEGKRHAQQVGLKPEKIAEVRTALATLDKAISSVKAAQFVMKMYGISVARVSASGQLSKMKQTAHEVRDALKVIGTTDGKEYATKAGLKPAKIAEVRDALAKLEKAIAEQKR